MSEIKVNNIQGLEGTHGPVVSGIATMSSVGAMTLPRGDTAYRGGRGRGVFSGGFVSPSTDTIDYVTIATLGNAIDFGNLSEAKRGTGSASSSTRGLVFAGQVGPAIQNTIEYITISATGNSFDFGDLTEATWTVAGLSNNVRASEVDPAKSLASITSGGHSG